MLSDLEVMDVVSCLMDGGAVRGRGGGCSVASATRLKVNVAQLLRETLSKAGSSGVSSLEAE